jgi:alkanesulfonate monooxygenase SsuD/methylene tetrahydromethanopterin reductase-like flavin-dependent oxidoreductase (luciferase family)
MREAPLSAARSSLPSRIESFSRNRLKLGLFGSNCSSGRAATRVPERWGASWEENLALAQMADDAGIDMMIPVGRWRGYGGETNFEGHSWESVTWATGLLAQTQRMHIFATVHAPLVHPVYAAKQFVTADHVSRGRFGLNIVCGWNQDEFDMFGVAQREHDDRYAYGAEWLDAIMQMWERAGAFDFAGAHIQLKRVEAEPKPYGGTRPLIMNAGSSPAGRAFSAKSCDVLFRPLRSLEAGAQEVQQTIAEAAAYGRAIGVFGNGYIVCRKTRKEAEDYHRYYAEEMGDWEAVDHLIAMNLTNSQSYTPEFLKAFRTRVAAGHGGFPMIGDPDDVAAALANVSAAGFAGMCFSFVNYLAEFPFFRDEVLPRLERMGLRDNVSRRTC